ncbi:MAG TPA: phosphotransferase [Trebonia sp.]
MTAAGRAPAPGDRALAARLLPSWGIPADASLVRADRGTNNQTFIVQQGRQRFVLRVSRNSTLGQVRAEHRILHRLHQAALPFRVPEPCAALDGSTVRETAQGPATLCRWIPGAHPVLEDSPALERFGRAAALLAGALRDMPLRDTLTDWRTGPLTLPGAVTDVSALCRGLRAAGTAGRPVARLRPVAVRPVAVRPVARGPGAAERGHPPAEPAGGHRPLGRGQRRAPAGARGRGRRALAHASLCTPVT